MNIKFHLVQFPQQVIGKFQIRLVDLIDQQNDLLFRVKSLPELAKFNIAGDVVYSLFPELAVIKPLYRIINVISITMPFPCLFVAIRLNLCYDILVTKARNIQKGSPNNDREFTEQNKNLAFF